MTQFDPLVRHCWINGINLSLVISNKFNPAFSLWYILTSLQGNKLKFRINSKITRWLLTLKKRNAVSLCVPLDILTEGQNLIDIQIKSDKTRVNEELTFDLTLAWLFFSLISIFNF